MGQLLGKKCSKFFTFFSCHTLNINMKIVFKEQDKVKKCMSAPNLTYTEGIYLPL